MGFFSTFYGALVLVLSVLYVELRSRAEDITKGKDKAEQLIVHLKTEILEKVREYEELQSNHAQYEEKQITANQKAEASVESVKKELAMITSKYNTSETLNKSFEQNIMLLNTGKKQLENQIIELKAELMDKSNALIQTELQYELKLNKEINTLIASRDLTIANLQESLRLSEETSANSRVITDKLVANATKNMADYSQQVDALQAELNEKEGTLNLNKLTIDKLKREMTELETSRKEFSELKDASAKQEESLAKEIDDLKAENAKLSSELESLKVDIETANSTHDKQTAELQSTVSELKEQYEKETGDLQTKLELQAKDHEKALAEKDTELTELVNTKAQAKDSDLEITQLREQVSTLQKNLDEARSEKEELITRISKKHDENAPKETESKDSGEQTSIQAELEARIKTLEEEKEVELGSLKLEVTKMKDEVEQKSILVNNLQEELKTLETKLSNTKHTAEAGSSEMKKTSSSDSKTSVEDNESDKQKLEDSVNKLAAAKKELQVEKEKAISQLQTENSDLKNKVQDLEKSIEIMKSSEKQPTGETNALDEAVNKAKALEESKEEVEQELAQMKGTIEDIKREQQEGISARNKLEETITKLSAQIEGSESDHAEAKLKLTAQIELLEGTKASLEAEKSKVLDLSSSLDELQEKENIRIQTIQNELDQTKQEKEALSKQVSELQTDNRQMRSTVEELKAVNDKEKVLEHKIPVEAKGDEGNVDGSKNDHSKEKENADNSQKSEMIDEDVDDTNNDSEDSDTDGNDATPAPTTKSATSPRKKKKKKGKKNPTTF